MGMIKKIWKITKFGTWNVHGLLDPEKLAIVERNILDTTIMRIAEIHWKD